MLGVLLLALCPLAGRCLLRWGVPSLQTGPAYSLSGKPLQLFLRFLTLPAGFCLGVLALGWAAYLSAYLARGTAAPMAVGGGAALLLGAALAGAELAHRAKSRPGSGRWVWRKGNEPRRPRTGKALRPGAFGGPEAFALAFAALAGGFVTFFTFWEDAAAISMAVNVYSDFSPHIAVIRSRNISASIVVQSISQLAANYDDNGADVITDCCDTTLFLGGKSEKTKKAISEGAGKQTVTSVTLNDSRGNNYSMTHNYARHERDLIQASEVGRLPADEAIVIINGENAFRDKKYRLSDHPRYRESDEKRGRFDYGRAALSGG